MSFFYFINLLITIGVCMQPPAAFKKPLVIEIHGDKRIDYYYWMRKRDSKEVLNYLKKENRYTQFVMKDYQKVENQIFNDLKKMIKEDDETDHVKYKNYFYFRRFFKGKDYPVYYRKKISDNKTEELIDLNKLAKGKKFFHFQSFKVSPDEKFVAWAEDHVGRRFYSIFIKECRENSKPIKIIDNVTSNFVWGRDSKTIYFVKQDLTTLRWSEVYKYDIDKASMKLIYREEDPAFYVYLSKSKTEKYVFINSNATLTSEVRYIDLTTNDNDEVFLFKHREKEVDYEIEDGGDVFYIRHNIDAKNFKISFVSKDIDFSNHLNWITLIEHRDDVFIEDFEVFKRFISVYERKNGLLNLRIISKDNKIDNYVDVKDDVYVISPGENLEYESNFYRYYYESPITPHSIYDYDINTSKSILIKEKEYPGYDSHKYEVKRVWAEVRDKTKVPITIVSKKGIISEKLLVYGYGAYGYSLDPEFDFSVFPLIDRGFSYAIIHVRGGGELGRKWYDDGRLLNKKNSFYDFIDSTLYLKSLGYGKTHVFANGASAGGLLMGAITNMAPELYTGIIAEVPFVDCLTTMLDETIPLTTSEYDEWGNPKDKIFYDYIKSYSPYDNVGKKGYPHMLVTSGYHDSQVQYWEPVKWVAKLRENNTSNSIILLKTDMDSGHSGKIGRYKKLREIAFKYSFIMKVINR